MKTLAEQFLQCLEKDLKDWEDAAAFFDKIRTVTMDGQICVAAPGVVVS